MSVNHVLSDSPENNSNSILLPTRPNALPFVLSGFESTERRADRSPRTTGTTIFQTRAASDGYAASD